MIGRSAIMVGGFAVNLHGFSRTTGDLDIWLKDEIENRRNPGRSLTLRANTPC